MSFLEPLKVANEKTRSYRSACSSPLPLLIYLRHDPRGTHSNTLAHTTEGGATPSRTIFENEQGWKGRTDEIPSSSTKKHTILHWKDGPWTLNRARGARGEGTDTDIAPKSTNFPKQTNRRGGGGGAGKKKEWERPTPPWAVERVRRAAPDETIPPRTGAVGSGPWIMYIYIYIYFFFFMSSNAIFDNLKSWSSGCAEERSWSVTHQKIIQDRNYGRHSDCQKDLNSR